MFAQLARRVDIKRIILTIFLLILTGSPAFAAIAYIGGNNQVIQSGDPFTTSAYTGTSGNLMVLGIFWKGAVTISSVTTTDSATCVDSGAGRLSRPTDGFLQIYYCPNLGGGSKTYTIDFSGAESELNVYKDEFSGVLTVSPVETTATGTATSGTNVTTGNIVISNSNDVIYAWAVANAASKYTAGTNFTIAQADANGNGGTEYGLFTPGTYTASMNMGSTLTKAGIIGVAFKAPTTSSTQTGPKVFGNMVITGGPFVVKAN